MVFLLGSFLHFISVSHLSFSLCLSFSLSVWMCCLWPIIRVDRPVGGSLWSRLSCHLFLFTDYILYVPFPQFALILREQISVFCLNRCREGHVLYRCHFCADFVTGNICSVTFCQKHYCPFVSMPWMNIYAAGLSPFMGPCFTQNLLRYKAAVINFSFSPVWDGIKGETLNTQSSWTFSLFSLTPVSAAFYFSDIMKRKKRDRVKNNTQTWKTATDNNT